MLQRLTQTHPYSLTNNFSDRKIVHLSLSSSQKTTTVKQSSRVPKVTLIRVILPSKQEKGQGWLPKKDEEENDLIILDAWFP